MKMRAAVLEEFGKPLVVQELELDEPKRLRCRWSGVFGDTEVTFELFPEGDGTRLRVRHDGWSDPPPEQRGGFDDGWKQKLDQDIPRVLGNA